MSLRSLIKPFALALALGTLSSTPFLAPAVAEDAPATQPAEKKQSKGPRVTGIWARLQSLTAEQKVKIAEIHKKSLADQRKIEAQEEADITALLTDEQKVELAAMKEEDAAKRKTKKQKPEADNEVPAGERKDGM